jgi:FAD dependent oxidoreductase
MKLTRRQTIKLLTYAGTVYSRPSAFATDTEPVDLLVYGATTSAVMTSYSAAREGLRVVLLAPEEHLGGMVTGGLSATDLGHYSIIGGYARDFYLRAAAHYGVNDLDQPADWLSEPHVGENIFRAMLQEAGVRVVFHEQLREQSGVELGGKRIVSISTTSGRRLQAAVFADCSYEGDLMAQAKVSYTWGREAASEYGESLAGVRGNTPKHQFLWPVSAYDDAHRLLPEIDAGPLAAPGSGDKKVQAYNFRLILTNDPANRLSFERPSGYDRSRFALLERYLGEYQQHTGRPPGFKDVTNPVMIPNHKADFNNIGPFSTDYIGHSWKYPEASYVQKAAIWQDHLLYTKSFFYFLSQDPGVPASLRAEVNQWGLPKDEFAGTDHWPHQLYIREARRMVGDYVMRQADLQSERTKQDSIGMGSYSSDSHNIQRVAMPDGTCRTKATCRCRCSPTKLPFGPSHRSEQKRKICWFLSASLRPMQPTLLCAWNRNT